MADTSADETRISELLWRTIKLRASLLALATVVSLIVWSAVLSGDQRANVVDAEYCQKLIALGDSSIAPIGAKPSQAAPMVDVTSTCSASSSRSYIEFARVFNAFLRDATGNSSEAARKSYTARESLLSEYDSKRKSSYNFRIQLSSEVSSGEMFVNALTVAEVVPFVILGLAATVVILGFQQRAYRVRLALLAHKDKDSTVSALARTQFFTFSTFAAKQNPQGIKWPVMSVEGMAIRGLAVALIITSAGLLFAFAENVVHFTDSIVHNYLSNLYGFAFTLAFWLVYTRRSYRETLEPAASSTAAKGSRVSFRAFIELFLVAIALATLLLPWASTPSGLSLKGYSFILPERPRAGIAGSSFFPVSPQLFSELRWQLAIALTFVVLCGIETLRRRRVNPTGTRWLYALRRAMAVLTLFWSLNLLLYMGVLEYESIQGTSWGIQNVMMAPFLGQGVGLPLDLYDPSYGFLVFLAACFALIRFSVPRLVSRFGRAAPDC
jgi:hypothetical protein